MTMTLSSATRRASWLALLWCVGVGGLGCSGELDPKEPDDAYLMFRDALFAGDAAQVWERLDPSTHDYFQKRYERLARMDQEIQRYLPQADWRLARKQSGTVLLAEVKDGKGLFMRLLTPKNVPRDKAFELGSEVGKVTLAEDKKSAIILTRGEQSYVMVRDDKTQQWHVALHHSTTTLKPDKSLAWLDANESALRQTVEDLIAEERARREAVIASLLFNKK